MLDGLFLGEAAAIAKKKADEASAKTKQPKKNG